MTHRDVTRSQTLRGTPMTLHQPGSPTQPHRLRTRHRQPRRQPRRRSHRTILSPHPAGIPLAHRPHQLRPRPLHQICELEHPLRQCRARPPRTVLTREALQLAGDLLQRINLNRYEHTFDTNTRNRRLQPFSEISPEVIRKAPEVINSGGRRPQHHRRPADRTSRTSRPARGTLATPGTGPRARGCRSPRACAGQRWCRRR